MSGDIHNSTPISTYPESIENLSLKNFSPEDKNAIITWKQPDILPICYTARWWNNLEAKIHEEKTPGPILILPIQHNGCTYSVQIAAENKSGCGRFSEVLEIELAPTAPTKVTVMENTSKPESSIIVKYEDSDMKENIYQITAQSLSSGEKFTYETGDRTAIMKNLIPGDVYEVSVVKFQNKMLSEPCFADRTILTYPAKVEDVQNTKSSATAQTISWSTVFGATEYIVKWKRTDTNYETERIGDTEIVLKKLERGQMYVVCVAAVNASGCGKFSEKLHFSTDLLPPTNVKMEVITSVDSLLLEVRFTEPGQMVKEYIGEVLPLNNEIQGKKFKTKSCFATIPDIQPGMRYMAYVQAVTESGVTSEKAYSDTVWTNPGQVEDVFSQSLSQNSQKVTWKSVEGASSYVVKLQQGGGQLKETTTKELEIYFSELQLDSTYTVSVAAVNHSGKGKFSDCIYFKTGLSPPEQVIVNNISEYLECGIIARIQSPKRGSDNFKISIIEASTNSVADSTQTQEHHVEFFGLKPGKEYIVSAQSIDQEVDTRSSVVICSDPIWTYCGKIEKIECRNVSPTSSTLVWTRVAGATSYLVKYKPKNGNYLSERTSQNEYTLKDLELGECYSVCVAAVNDAGTGKESETQYVNTGMCPPSNVMVSTHRNDPAMCVDVSFKEPEIKPKGYTISIMGVSCNHTKQITTENNFARVTNLLPGIQYRVSVCSVGENTSLNSDKIFSSSPFWTCPGKVQSVEVSMESHNSHNVTWDCVTGAKEYEVKWRRAASKPMTRKTNATSMLLENLHLNSEYSVVVRAVNSAGEGIESEPKAFQTALFPPTNVTGRNNENSPSSALDIKFTSARIPGMKYRIRVLSLKNGADVAFEETRNNFATITELQSGENYKVFVSSVHDENENLNSEETSSEEIWTYPAKLTVQTSQVSKTEQKVMWEKVEGALEYEVEWRKENGEWKTSKTNQTEMILKELELGSNYELQVSAINKGGKGDKSDRQRFTTVPPQPQNVQYKILTTDAILFTCNECTGTTSYKFSVTFLEENKTTDLNCTKPECLFQHSGPSVNFKVHISAKNNVGWSEQSNEIEFRQVLHYLANKNQKVAKNIFDKARFISPILYHLDSGKDVDFESLINPNPGELIIVAGGQFVGKTAICCNYLQSLTSKNLALYLDYEVVRSVAQKLDMKSFLNKFMTDLTSSEMDFLMEWMESNSQQVTFVVDNLSLPEGFEGKQYSYEQKESVDFLIYNIVKVNREIFPNSQVLCTTLQDSIRGVLHPTEVLGITGFDEDRIEQMAEKLLGNVGDTERIPSKLKYLCCNPCFCEIVLRLVSKKTDIDLSSSAAIFAEILSQIMSHHSENMRRMKVLKMYEDVLAIKQEKFNNIVSPMKVPKVKGRPRESIGDYGATKSAYSDLPSFMDWDEERNGTHTSININILQRICLQAMYIALLMSEREFEKQFGKRGLNMGHHARVWNMVAGFFRETTLENVCKIFKSVVSINKKDVERKATKFKMFAKKNMGLILDQIYINSQITLDWFTCCIELGDRDLMVACSPKIKVKQGISDNALDQLSKFLKEVPGQLCGNIKIKRKKDDVHPSINLTIDNAIRSNPHGEHMLEGEYEKSSVFPSKRGVYHQPSMRLSRVDSTHSADGRREFMNGDNERGPQSPTSPAPILDSKIEDIPETSLAVAFPAQSSQAGIYKAIARSVSDGTERQCEVTASPAIIHDINPGDAYDVKVYNIQDNHPPKLTSQSCIQTSKSVGKEGGKVSVGGCELEFPEGAFAKPTKVHIKNCPMPPDLPAEYLEIAPALDFQASGEKFLKPVQCTVPTWCRTSKEDIKVHIFLQNGKKFEEIDKVPLTDDLMIHFQCDHFTVFRFAVKIKHILGLKFEMYMCLFYDSHHRNFLSGVCLREDREREKMTRYMRERRCSFTPFGYQPFTAKIKDTIVFNLSQVDESNASADENIGEWNFLLEEEFFCLKRDEYLSPLKQGVEGMIRLIYKATKKNEDIKNLVFNFDLQNAEGADQSQIGREIIMYGENRVNIHTD